MTINFDEPAILLQTPDFLAAAKLPGMETISQDGGPELTAILRRTLNEPGLTPVHRLDRDTSGVQLMARTPQAEKELTALFRKRLMEKTYLAICLGVPRNRQGVINRRLTEWKGGRRPVQVVKQGGMEASTSYRVLAASTGAQPIGLLAFSPHQGRTHQIRVHAAALGYPILGDDQYGDRNANREFKRQHDLARQALHSWKLAFDWRGKRFTVVCPPPEDMMNPMRALFASTIDRPDIKDIFR